ncbi:hypothetical protein ACFVRU_56805 [Streptomyces sp. NPDC057927]
MENQFMYLVDYINKSIDIENPIGFMKYKVNNAVKAYENSNEKVSFVKLLDTLPKKRQDSANKGPKVPEWFSALKKEKRLTEDASEKEPYKVDKEDESEVNFEEEKRKVLANIGQ